MTTVVMKGSQLADTLATFGSLTIPKLSHIGIGAIDSAGRAIEGAEQALATLKTIADDTIPTAVRFAGTLVLPEILNYQVARVATSATQLGTSLLVNGGNAMLNVSTFGAPTWLKAARRALATSNETLRDTYSSGSEFLARCIADTVERPTLRQDLLRYIELRKELRTTQQEHGADSEQARKVEHTLMVKETVLKGYQDFQAMKDALDGGLQFVQNNHERVLQLAEKAAERILSKVENYYTERIGEFGSQVQGSYAQHTTDAERFAARTELRDRIAAKLNEVFANEMESGGVRHNLHSVSQDLLDSFGAYRQGAMALSYVALGAAYYTGGLTILANEALEFACGLKDSAFAYLGSAKAAALQWAWDNTFGALVDAVTEFANAVDAAVKSRMPFIFGPKPDSAVNASGGWFSWPW